MSAIANQIMAILESLSPEEFSKVFSEITQRVVELKKEQYHLKPFKIYPAVKTIPIKVWDIFSSQFEDKDPSPEEWLDIGEIREGLERVEFTLENAEYQKRNGNRHWGNLLGPRMFGNVAGIGCYGGGDWEWPIFFLIYLDADNKTLRSYIPKEGNPWNHQTGAAFGNDYDMDIKFFSECFAVKYPGVKMDLSFKLGEQYGHLLFDEEKILQDITENISVVG